MPQQQYELDQSKPVDRIVLLCGFRLKGHRWRNTTRKRNDYCLDCNCRRMVWIHFVKTHGVVP